MEAPYGEHKMTIRQYRLLHDVSHPLYMNVLHSVESTIELSKDELFFGETIPLEDWVFLYIPLPGAKIKIRVERKAVEEL